LADTMAVMFLPWLLAEVDWDLEEVGAGLAEAHLSKKSRRAEEFCPGVDTWRARAGARHLLHTSPKNSNPHEAIS
jgi:hypothetical protein